MPSPISATPPDLKTANSSSQTLLEELDARQDEVLAKLDELNLRLEQVLRQCGPLVEREAA